MAVVKLIERLKKVGRFFLTNRSLCLYTVWLQKTGRLRVNHLTFPLDL